MDKSGTCSGPFRTDLPTVIGLSRSFSRIGGDRGWHCGIQTLAALALIAFSAAGEADPALTVHGVAKPLPAGAVTHDWPSFLGPTHDMHSTETGLAKSWPATGPVKVWERKRGSGYAAPAIAGGKLVLVHRVDDDNTVECCDPATGTRFWAVRFPTTYQDRYGYNNGPRSSPVIDGDAIFWHSQDGVLRCLALADGATRWTRELSREHKVPQDFFGVASTPLVHGDLLIVAVGAPKGPGVVGLDKRTGATRWSADDQWGAGYASPIPAVLNGQNRVLLLAGGESRPPTGGLLVIDPADGRITTRFPWRSKSYESVNASCPVAIGDRVFISASYNTGGAMLDIKPDSGHAVAWTSEDAGTHFMTAVHHRGYIYASTGRNEPDAELVCLDAAKGTVLWREAPRWPETLNGRNMQLGMFRANLLRVDGRFLCLGEFGHLAWYDLSPQGCTEQARHWLFPAQQTWTPPVLSRGLLYIMQNDRGKDGSTTRLICYDLRGG